MPISGTSLPLQDLINPDCWRCWFTVPLPACAEICLDAAFQLQHPIRRWMHSNRADSFLIQVGSEQWGCVSGSWSLFLYTSMEGLEPPTLRTGI